MTRSWIESTFPLALSAGFLLAHCSGGRSTVGADGGQTMGTGSGTSAGMQAGSGTGTGHGIGTGTGIAAGTGTGTGIAAGTGTGTGIAAGTGTGTGVGADCGAGPAGGAHCDPGIVVCAAGADCNVPAQECCLANDAGACVTAGGSCGGNVINCDEKADCTGGQICCLSVTSISGAFTITCQTGSCPTSGLAHAQVCKTNAECPGNSCTIYNCMGQITEACENPAPVFDPRVHGDVAEANVDEWCAPNTTVRAET